MPPYLSCQAVSLSEGKSNSVSPPIILMPREPADLASCIPGSCLPSVSNVSALLWGIVYKGA